MKARGTESITTRIEPVSNELPPDITGKIRFKIHIETPLATAVRIIEITIDTSKENAHPIRYGQSG